MLVAHPREIARPVDEGQDEDFALCHSIDEAVTVNEKLTDLRITQLRNDAPPLAKC